jgi:hypothetical protein
MSGEQLNEYKNLLIKQSEKSPESTSDDSKRDVDMLLEDELTEFSPGIRLMTRDGHPFPNSSSGVTRGPINRSPNRNYILTENESKVSPSPDKIMSSQQSI